MKRNIYLQAKDISVVQDVINQILKNNPFHKTEMILVKDSLSRITSSSVIANVSSPCYNASAMDGYAIRSKDTLNADEDHPVSISKDNYQLINTGEEVPSNYDAVVMIEDVQMSHNLSITVIRHIKSYENIRPIGEDIINGDTILHKNHKIRPIDISVMLSARLTELEVYQKPKVAIIPTGNEIIDDPKKLTKGKIIDSNSYFLKNELLLDGMDPLVFDIVPDNQNELKEKINEATNHYDLVLIGAGSSAGSKDYTKHIIEELGTVHIHGISIKPGKPTIIGEVNNTSVIGVPGYPVSTYITYSQVIKKLVLGMLEQPAIDNLTVKARLPLKVYSSLKHHEYVRMKLGYINGEYVATALSRKAGSTRSVVDADGILEIPKNSEGYEKNSVVNIQLLKDTETIKKSLVVVGSHDIILDTLNNLMIDKGYHISSSHVGSFSGVLGMKANSAHIAPVHILHTDGTYNAFLIDKYLDKDYRLIKGVNRQQGLYVKKGNPKNIQSIEDLVREDITFVNRQKGSGTRTLLDYLLQEKNLHSNQINGYNFELATHTLVASSVLDDRFDTGLGIKSVAILNNLDFIPVALEEYDFIIHKDSLELEIVKQFIHILKSDVFKKELAKLSGYTTNNIGEVL